MTATVGIVIRTLNESSHLATLIDCISRQHHDFYVQIIVVDTESTDGTNDYLHRKNIPFVSIPAKLFSFGRALNLGIRSLSEEPDVVVSISAHCIPSHSFWLRNLVSPVLANNLVMATGDQYSSPLSRSSEVNWFIQRPHINLHIASAFQFNNANSAFSYGLWRQHQFDNIISAQEDIEFALHHLLYNKAHVILVTDASVTHIHEFTNKQLVRRLFIEAYQECLLFGFPLRVFWAKLLGSFRSIPIDVRLAYSRKRIVRAIPGILTFRLIEVLSVTTAAVISGLMFAFTHRYYSLSRDKPGGI